jgi:hypothetical protein
MDHQAESDEKALRGVHVIDDDPDVIDAADTHTALPLPWNNSGHGGCPTRTRARACVMPGWDLTIIISRRTMTASQAFRNISSI